MFDTISALDFSALSGCETMDECIKKAVEILEERNGGAKKMPELQEMFDDYANFMRAVQDAGFYVRPEDRTLGERPEYTDPAERGGYYDNH